MVPVYFVLAPMSKMFKRRVPKMLYQTGQNTWRWYNNRLWQMLYTGVTRSESEADDNLTQFWLHKLYTFFSKFISSSAGSDVKEDLI